MPKHSLRYCPARICVCVYILCTHVMHAVSWVFGVVVLSCCERLYIRTQCTTLQAWRPRKAWGSYEQRKPKKTLLFLPASIENDRKCAKYGYGVCRYVYQILIIWIFVPRSFDPYFRRGVEGRTQKKRWSSWLARCAPYTYVPPSVLWDGGPFRYPPLRRKQVHSWSTNLKHLAMTKWHISFDFFYHYSFSSPLQ